MLRPILRLGDSILSEPTRAVERITPELDTLINDMIETMYAAPGVGLAAPQVGVSLKLFVIDISIGRDPTALHVMVNPEFEEYTIEGTGLLARALQHEIDHLNSCLFVDRLRGISRDLILRKIKKMSKAGKW